MKVTFDGQHLDTKSPNAFNQLFIVFSSTKMK